MSEPQKISLKQFRDETGEMMHRIVHENATIILTRHRRPEVALISLTEFQGYARYKELLRQRREAAR